MAGRTKMFCRLIGGYGRKPIRLEALDEATRRDAAGKCATFAEIPTLDDGVWVHELSIVMSDPVHHDRETIPFDFRSPNPSSFKPD